MLFSPRIANPQTIQHNTQTVIIGPNCYNRGDLDIADLQVDRDFLSVVKDEDGKLHYAVNCQITSAPYSEIEMSIIINGTNPPLDPFLLCGDDLVFTGNNYSTISLLSGLTEFCNSVRDWFDDTNFFA